jgi:hypothetical protein
MTADEHRDLVEATASAFRSVAPDGTIRDAPSWHDLDAQGRIEAAALALELRKLEAALDPDGLSTTAKLVLARIRGEVRGG